MRIMKTVESLPYMACYDGCLQVRGKTGGNVGEMHEADEMSTEVMENAANAAAKRREIRNRRILMDPEARMRKLTGYNNANQAAGQMPAGYPRACTPTTAGSRALNGAETDAALFSRTPLPPPDDFLCENAYAPSAAFASGMQASPGPDANLADLFQTLSGMGQAVPGALGPVPPGGDLSVPSAGFTRVRWVLVTLLGLLVRVSLIYSLGRRFIQSIINPFVFIEIAFIGYQRGVGMDLGGSVRGGLWLSVLVLSGIKPDIIDSYKVFMSIVTAVIDDFSLYFFAFVLVHLACLPFA